MMNAAQNAAFLPFSVYHSLAHFFRISTAESTTSFTPAFAAALLNLKSLQWNPPGITNDGTSGVDLSGPPGLYSEATLAVFHGSNSPLTYKSLLLRRVCHPLV